MRMAGLHPLLGAALSPSEGSTGRDLPFQQQAGTELVLDNGVTLLGAAIEVSSSNDTLVTVVFTLGQAAPSCISNTS